MFLPVDYLAQLSHGWRRRPETQLSAQHLLAFEEFDRVTPQCGYPGCLQSGRAASDDHDVFRLPRRHERTPLGGAPGLGVVQATYRKPFEQLFYTNIRPNARPDVFRPPLANLAYYVGIGYVCPSHADHIGPSFRDNPLGVGRVGYAPDCE